MVFCLIERKSVFQDAEEMAEINGNYFFESRKSPSTFQKVIE